MSAATIKANSASLNYVTAIVNGEIEAEVAQLLFTHGNNIIFRALNQKSLVNFLAQQDMECQIIYCEDFASDTAMQDIKGKYTQFKFTQISTGFDPATLLADLSQSTRQPLLRKAQQLPNLISILGTFGSPGVSTITNQLAARFTSSTILYPSNNSLRPISNNQSQEMLIDNFDFTLPTSSRYFLDAGSTKALTGSVSDRRFSGQLLNWALNSSAKLIYVLKPDENGISVLSAFLNDYKNLISPPPIIYILNQQRFNAKARLINTQFLSLVSGQVQFQVPYDFAAAQKYPTGKQWLSSTFSKQLDLISKSLA